VPELPEVETIRRQLAPRLRGRTITEAWAFPSAKFSGALDALGRCVERVGRRGKYLLCDLDDDRQLAIHLGMTGVVRLRRTGEPADTAREPYIRARWTLDDCAVVELDDVRRFGRVAVVPRDDHRSLPTLHALGPEPLSDGFEPVAFHAALARSGRAVKTQLLSQRPVAGVGNIYADEALWQARVHPASRRVTRPQAARLHAAIRDVLTEAIGRRGTTLRDYRTPDGGTGTNQHRLFVYGRAGAPCTACGTTLRAITLDARTATFCPKCQVRR
jgi:formamidopyrimidine-DNA glycosylase